ncbi:hypothetical protein B296_00005324 [Ensete ventricosum]|uniref:Uncharacterized protein n=1 Tax=Ensete ventricosum TaxID=4639 RepID=A0A427AWY6_ENSVE|nr:hypothetical protein B296_00005324 [Ensete ventricosum]
MDLPPPFRRGEMAAEADGFPPIVSRQITAALPSRSRHLISLYCSASIIKWVISFLSFITATICRLRW